MKLGILYSYRYFCFYYFFTLSGNTGSHSKLATTMCSPPPSPTLTPCKYLFYSTTIFCSVVLHRECGGGEEHAGRGTYIYWDYKGSFINLLTDYTTKSLLTYNFVCKCFPVGLEFSKYYHSITLFTIIYPVFGPMEAYSYKFC